MALWASTMPAMHTATRVLRSVVATVPLCLSVVAAPQSSTAPASTQAPTPAPAKGIQWTTGDYTWKVGGYIKLDLIHDFDEIGSTDSFDPRTIPTDDSGEPGDSTRIHARQTRFNLDIRGPTDAGDFRAFFEGDFYGDKNSFRIRHAFGSVGGVLGGQTWTTFMDEDAMPETIDFETPVAYPMIRQGMVRWTQPLEDGSYWAVALEDPDSDVLAPTGVQGETDEPLPDLAARVHLSNDRGHVQLGLFGGMARFDPVTGPTDDVALWGVNLSTRLRTIGKDNAIVQVTAGDGVGRYRGGITAAPGASGELEAVPVVAILGSYQHHWSDEYRSTLAYSWGEGDVPAGSPATTNEELTYLAANLIWQFTERAWAGLEYLYGTRDTFDGADGDAHRLQFALRFDI